MPSGSPVRSGSMPLAEPHSRSFETKARSPVSHAVTPCVSKTMRWTARPVSICRCTSLTAGSRSSIFHLPESRTSTVPSAGCSTRICHRSAAAAPAACG